jgi:hypothetical protein
MPEWLAVVQQLVILGAPASRRRFWKIEAVAGGTPALPGLTKARYCRYIVDETAH